MADDVVTVTETRHTSVKRILWDWLSDDDGAASGATAYAYDGLLERVVFIPDGGGTQPDASYDVVINDPNGVDVLAGLCAARSTSASVVKTHANGLTAVAGQ